MDHDFKAFMFAKLHQLGYTKVPAGMSERQMRKWFRRATGNKTSSSRVAHQSDRECARRRQQMAYDAHHADRRTVRAA